MTDQDTPPGPCAPPFYLGAMYWQNPNYGKAEVEADMRRIRENQFTIIRKFIWWEKVERKEGRFEFEEHDILYEAAAKYGLEVMETYGLYLPQWLKVKLASAGILDRDRYYCLDRPEVSAPMRRFVEAVVGRYKDAPALRIWNVWNEPTKPPCHCVHTRTKFLVWLKEKYRSIEALQAAWMGEFQVFETLCPDTLEELDLQWLEAAFTFGLRGRMTPLDYDWHQFSAVNLTENIQWLADITKAIDPVHETHANPNCPAGNPLMDGQDIYQQTGVLDSISESVHPSHHFYNEQDPAKYPVSQSFSADKIASWGRAHGKDAWIGELQAGTTFYHPVKYTPSASEVTHALWQAVGRGIRGVLFWEWQAWRSSMMEVGEFSLRRPADGGPTERSEAAGDVGRLLDAYADVFREVRRPRSRIALFFSSDTSCLKAIQKRGKPFIEELEHEHTFALYGCYKALNAANLAVDFVNEAMILEGVLENYTVLYMPHVELMARSTAEAVKAFVREGGHLWADGRCAFLNEHVYLRDGIPGHGLDEVFGCTESDFVALASETGMTMENGEAVQAYRMAQYLEPTTGSVRAWFSGGQPAIVVNTWGKGTAELAGTYLALGLRNHDDPETMEYLAGIARRAGAKPIVDIEPSSAMEVSRLSGEKHDVFIVTNHRGDSTTAVLKTGRAYASVECPMDPGTATDYCEGVIRRPFGALETAIFICNK